MQIILVNPYLTSLGGGGGDSGPDPVSAIADTGSGTEVTFNFSTAIRAGAFATDADGIHLWADSSQGAFSITSIMPASAVVDGYKAHGAMSNPNTLETQGFDALLEVEVIAAAAATYDDAKNIDPGNTSAPIEISQGQEITIVKCVRFPGLGGVQDWQTIEKYVYLHVLNGVPSSTAYPPAAATTTKTLFNRNSVSTNCLRSLSMPSSFTTAYNYATQSALIPADQGVFGSMSHERRRYRLDKAAGASAVNYSAEISLSYVPYWLMLHDSRLTTEQRAALIDKVVVNGIQIWGQAVQNNLGITISHGFAGQGFVVLPWVYLTAFLLQSQSMYDTARVMIGGTVSMAEWGVSGNVGRAAGGKADRNAQTFFDEHVGVPFVIPDEFGSNIDTRYGQIGADRQSNEIMPILLLQNGPGGKTGVDLITNNGTVNDTTNNRSAVIAMADRMRTWNLANFFNSYNIDPIWRDIYDLVQSTVGWTKWTGRPDQVHYGTGTAYDNDWFSVGSGDGEIDWDLGSFDFATETITQYDVRYSLDGVQWIESLDAGVSGTLSGLLRGRAHHCGIRQVSASGAGLWSPNYPQDVGDSDRGVVTTTGTATAAAPVFTVDPVICAALHAAWSHPYWVPVSGTLAEDQVQLSCGLGYHSGYPAATHTFQWKRDGSNISGATSQTYNRTAADATADLTCEITATNATGSDVHTTAAVTAPGLTAIPSSTLIDTDFGWPFIIDYETEFAARTTSNATVTHRPTESFPLYGADEGIDVDPVNNGALFLDKTGNQASVIIPLKNPAVAGRTYNVTGQLVVNYGNALPSGATARLQIRNGATTVLFESATTQASVGTITTGVVVDFSGEIVVAGGETDLDWDFRLWCNTGTGGGSGDLYLTRLVVAEA